jgi:hypothetical protein
MMKKYAFMVMFTLMVAFQIGVAQAWMLPKDNGTISKDETTEILSGNDCPETTSYTQRIEYIDFSSYGKKFTQVVIYLEPKQPLIRNGKKVVVVATEPGSEYGMDFIETVEGKEAMGGWLAKRGITFIALTRVGRWNFLGTDGTGSWKDIPLGERMPIFNRDQKINWARNDYTVKPASGGTSGATAAEAEFYRFPNPGTELYHQMLAATPDTILKGYALGIDRVLPPSERGKSILLYWGMSTGGAFVWPLAKYVRPDGFMGWGTSTTGLAYLVSRAKQGNFDLPYEKSCLRVRERGIKDFIFYTRHIPETTREAWYQNALKTPRFKSIEDPMMFFNSGALTEMAMRLWVADFLPAEYKKAGPGQFVKNILEPCFPPGELKDLPVLEMNGTLDEGMTPKVVDAYRQATEQYFGKYRVARIQDLHHYLFTQDSIKIVGSVWLKFIESGYFDGNR